MPPRRKAQHLPTPDATLTDRELVFCREFIVDFNASQACKRAGIFGKSHKALGYTMLQRPNVQREISRLCTERAARLEITADAVVAQWWALATADPRELVEYRRTCCRFCYGVEHRFQRTKAQFERDRAEFESKQSKKSKDEFDEQGGDGYNATKPPHPACPECFGQGVGTMVVSDTRKLSAAALRLYAGVKETKEGLEVKMHDPMMALTNVARHLRMFEDAPSTEDADEKAAKIKAQLDAMDAASASAA